MNWWQQDPVADPTEKAGVTGSTENWWEQDARVEDGPAAMETVNSPAAQGNRSLSEWMSDTGKRVSQTAHSVTGGLLGLPVNLANSALQPIRNLRGAAEWSRDAVGLPAADNVLSRALDDILSPIQQPDVVRGMRESIEYDIAESRESMTPQAQALDAGLEQTEGFLDTVGYLAQRPAYALQEIIAQAPQAMQMVPGSLPGTIAAQMAGVGSQAEQQVAAEAMQRGMTPEEAAAAGAAAFSLTAPVGALGAAVPGGLAVERMLTGQLRQGVARNLAGRAGLAGTAIAGETATETAQEGLEQLVQNYALGDPLGEGVAKAAAQGAVLGAGMGAPAGLASAAMAQAADAPPSRDIPPTPGVTENPDGTVTIDGQTGSTTIRGGDPDAIRRATTPSPADAMADADLSEALAALQPREQPATPPPPGTTREELVAQYESTQSPEERSRIAGQIASLDRRPKVEPSSIPLEPDQREAEAEALRMVEQDWEGLVEGYRNLPDTNGGRTINTDSARELFPVYNNSKDARTRHAASVHEASSAIAHENYVRRLDEPTPEGRESVVFFTGGGGGAGKSSGINRIPELAANRDRSDILFDGTMSNLRTAVQNIEDALASGRAADIVYTLRDIPQAMRWGVASRAAGSGRVVPARIFVNAHIGAARTYLQLRERYADNPNVKLSVIWNDWNGPGDPGRVWIPEDAEIEALANTDPDAMLAQVQQVVREAEADGVITPTIREAINGPEAAAAAPQATREPGADRPGAEGSAGQPAQPAAGQPAEGSTGAVQRAGEVPSRARASEGASVSEGLDRRDTPPAERRVGTRNPTAKRATESGADPSTVVSYESFRADPAAFERNTALVMQYPGIRVPRGRATTERKAEAFLQHAVDNLLALHDAMPAELRDRAKRWYEGANRAARDLSRRYGITDVQAAAAIAALSPQKDWFQNLSLAERVIDAHVNQSNRAWDPAMTETMSAILGKPQYEKLRAAIEGRRLDELTDPVERAAWTRVYDQTHNDSAYPIASPEGDFIGTFTTAAGKPAQVQWGSMGEIAKAVSVLENGSLENVSDTLGRMHKIRSFYNNIIAPNSTAGDVTIDTHAVAAALLRPLSATTVEVGHNFGTGTSNSSITGNSGTYGLYAEAYRRAAEERGVLPREMQSITWEAVRTLFPRSSRKPNSRAVRETTELWNQYKQREIEHAEAVQRAIDAGGGIRTPDWAGSTGGLDEGQWRAAFRPAVSGAGVPRGGAEPASSRDRGRPAERAEQVGERGIHPDAAVTLNIGLSTAEERGGGELTRAEVMRAVRATGARVLNDSRQISDSEPTLVVDLDRPLTRAEGDRLSRALDQQAIVQRSVDGSGELFGPMADEWGPYNPALFVLHDGERAGDGARTVIPPTAEEVTRRAETVDMAEWQRRSDAGFDAIQGVDIGGWDLSGDELAMVAAASEILQESGYPAAWIDAANGVFVHGSHMAFSGRFWLSPVEGLVSFRENALEAGDIGRLVAHEFTHAIDHSRADGEFMSARSPLFEIGVKEDGALDYRGEIVAEMQSVWESEVDSDLTDELSYPFLSASDTSSSSTRLFRSMDARITAIEAFAQAVTVYFTMPEQMRAHMPKTHAFVEEIINGDHSTVEASQATVRAALRVPGRGQGGLRPDGRRAAGADRGVDQEGRAGRGAAGGQSRPDGVTDTAAFRRWFGNSKVVDANGEPMVVYHGTSATFTEFDTDGGTGGSVGAYFSEERSVASSYAEQRGGQVYPVYLRMENPLVVPSEEFPHIRSGHLTAEERAELEAAGYDGVIGWQFGWREFVAFRPEQIKSATGNSGEFSPTNPSILGLGRRRTRADANRDRARNLSNLAAAHTGRARPVGFTQDASEWVGTRAASRLARERLQDSMIALRDVQEDIEVQTGQVLDDAYNAYVIENLMRDKAGDMMREMERRFIEPMAELLRREGVPLRKFEGYLLARATPEINAKVAAIRPDMQDGGSGLTNAQAQGILDGTEPDPYTGEPITPQELGVMRQAAKLIDGLRKWTLDTRQAQGLMSAEQRKALDEQRFYVPARGFIGEEDQLAFGGRRRGTLTTRGQRIRQRFGRGAGNLPVDIVGNMISDAQHAAWDASVAPMRKAILRLALRYKNPDVWEVEPVDMEWRLGADGKAYMGIKSSAMDANTSVLVPHDGKFYRVRINDPHLQRALLDSAGSELNVILRVFSAINRWQAAVFTRFNPLFPVVALTRGGGFGLTYVASNHGAETALQTLIGAPGAAKGLFADNREPGDSSVPDSKKTWADWAREARETGASISVANMGDVKDISRNLVRELQGVHDMWREGARATAVTTAVKRAVGPLTGAIETLNDAFENALRLSAYVALRKQGRTPQQAAVTYKEMMTNFRRRGSMRSELGAIWLFFNPAMQGGKAFFKLAKDPKVLAGLNALGAMQAMSAWMLMGIDDDEDGVTAWDEIEPWKKERSFIIPIGAFTGDYRDNVYIPLEYGFNIFPYAYARAAQSAHDQLTGRERPGQHFVSDMARVASRSFSPIPFDETGGLFGNVVAIYARLKQNKDDLGRPITAGQNYAPDGTPRASMGTPDTSPAFQAVATGLNRLGGGDDYTPPYILPQLTDVSPQEVEYLLGEALGGIGNLFTQSSRLAQNLSAGTYESAMDLMGGIPVARSFVSRSNRARAVSQEFYDQARWLTTEVDRFRDNFARGTYVDDEHAKIAFADMKRELGWIGEGLELDTYAENSQNEKLGRAGDIKRSPDGRPRLKNVDASVLGELEGYEYFYHDGSRNRVGRQEGAMKAVRDYNKAIRDLRAHGLTYAQMREIPGARVPPGVDPDDRVSSDHRLQAIKQLQEYRMETQRRWLRSLNDRRKESR